VLCTGTEDAVVKLCFPMCQPCPLHTVILLFDGRLQGKCLGSIHNINVFPSQSKLSPFCRLSITTESFIPSTVKLGNRLDQFDRNLDTLTKFKKAIRKEQSDNTKRIPENLILFLLNFVTRIPF
jgi:hypothetical protein